MVGCRPHWSICVFYNPNLNVWFYHSHGVKMGKNFHTCTTFHIGSNFIHLCVFSSWSLLSLPIQVAFNTRETTENGKTLYNWPFVWTMQVNICLAPIVFATPTITNPEHRREANGSNFLKGRIPVYVCVRERDRWRERVCVCVCVLEGITIRMPQDKCIPDQDVSGSIFRIFWPRTISNEDLYGTPDKIQHHFKSPLLLPLSIKRRRYGG